MKDEDLLTIKKFSEYTGIKQSVLRHYDEIGLFKPFKRDENGYRYYSAPQTISINLISVLHNAKISVKTIKEFVKHRTPEQILALFREQELELNKDLLRLQQAYSIVHTYTAMIEEGLHAETRELSIQHMPEMALELGPENDYSSGYLYVSFFNFLEKMEERNISSAYPAGGYYENLDSFIEKTGEPDRYFMHFPTGRDKKPVGEYLVGYARGYYGQLGDLPNRMKDYINENDLISKGPVYEMYLFDEVVVDNPDQYLIQVSVQIERKRVSKKNVNK